MGKVMCVCHEILESLIERRNWIFILVFVVEEIILHLNSYLIHVTTRCVITAWLYPDRKIGSGETSLDVTFMFASYHRNKASSVKLSQC